MCTISVIIPVYNVEKYLKECLESVLIQTFKDFEIILINDGSTDSSGDIIDYYSKKYSSIKAITTENQGLSCARNIGIEASSGEYLFFLDSDDKIFKNAFEIFISEINSKKLDALFFSSDVFMDEDLCTTKSHLYSRPKNICDKIISGIDFFNYSMELKKYIVSSCMFICSREAVGQLRFYPNIYHEDNLFTTQLLISGRLNRVYCIDDSLYHRRVRANSITTQIKSKKHIEGLIVVVKELNKLISKITDKKTKVILSYFISDTLHQVLFLSTKVYPFWVPISLRKYVLSFSLNITHGKKQLAIRSIAPHSYEMLLTLRALIKNNYFRCV